MERAAPVLAIPSAPGRRSPTLARLIVIALGSTGLMVLLLAVLVGRGWISGIPGAGQDLLRLAWIPAQGAGALPIAPQVPARPPENFGVGGVDPEKNERISAAIRRVRSATVALEYETGNPAVPRRVATGVVINDGGEVLSVPVDPPADRDRASVIACDDSGHRHQARWLAIDPDTGLTLLRVEANDMKPIRQAAGDPSLGAEVFMIGNPYGLGHSVSRGHIAGLGRRLRMRTQNLAGLIQIQASFHPGDSGAPLSDLDGGWLGLFRGGLAPAGVGGGLDNDVGFVIPARDALWVADRLRSGGKVDRAYLGLKFAPDAEGDRPFDPAVRPQEETGARVTEIMQGSPADRADLRRGDRVIGIDGRPVVASNDLTDRLERTGAGVELVLEYMRDGQRHRATIRATSRPAPAVLAGGNSPPPSGSSGGAGTPGKSALVTPRSDARAEETAAVIIQDLRDRLSRLEKRVEQLERDRRGPKSASNP